MPNLAPGDVVQLVVSLDEEGRFVLVSVREDDGEKRDDDEGVDVDDDEVTVRGTIAALAAARSSSTAASSPALSGSST